MWFDLLHLDVCVCCYIYAMLAWLGVAVVWYGWIWLFNSVGIGGSYLLVLVVCLLCVGCLVGVWYY